MGDRPYRVNGLGIRPSALTAGWSMTKEELKEVKVGTRVVATRGRVVWIQEVEKTKQYLVLWDEPHRVRKDDGSIAVIRGRWVLEGELDFYEILPSNNG